MLACQDDVACARLVEAGSLRLREVEQRREHAEQELLRRLRQFEARRACWA
jgi:hypothetical protein